jgi:transposase-like protein
MAGYKRIPKEIKDEVLSLVKKGRKVPEIANEFGINPNTIYKWLSNFYIHRHSFCL